MIKILAACLRGMALVALAAPAVAQTPAPERYPACQQAAVAEDRRIVEQCEQVDDMHERLGALNSADRRRLAELNLSLSSALFTIGFFGDDDLALADSIEAGRAAAPYYHTDRERLRWASLQLQIAGALNERARRGGDAYAREAADASRAGIAAVSRSQDPELWGALHNALANALMRLGRSGDRASLEEAAATLRIVLDGYRGRHHAAERETTQRNLDRVLRMLGEANES